MLLCCKEKPKTPIRLEETKQQATKVIACVAGGIIRASKNSKSLQRMGRR